jgi:hypothetical protein
MTQLETAAEPFESVTVPHAMRGKGCAVFEQVVEIPQVGTFLRNGRDRQAAIGQTPICCERREVSPLPVSSLNWTWAPLIL